MSTDIIAFDRLAEMMRVMAQSVTILSDGAVERYLYKFKKYRKVKRTCWIGAVLFERIRSDVAVSYTDRGGSRPCRGKMPDLSTLAQQTEHIRGRFVTMGLFAQALADPHSVRAEEDHAEMPLALHPQWDNAIANEPSFNPSLYGAYGGGDHVYGSPLKGVFDALGQQFAGQPFVGQPFAGHPFVGQPPTLSPCPLFPSPCPSTPPNRPLDPMYSPTMRSPTMRSLTMRSPTMRSPASAPIRSLSMLLQEIPDFEPDEATE